MGASSSTSTYPPSSSSFSSSSHSSRYEVFLSFRGVDTREGFTGNLYRALRDVGIRAFMDDQEKIEETIIKAIRESMYCVVVLSSGYAASKWCLKELAAMFHYNREIIPVFYHVDPYDVRHQTGPFETSFTSHKQLLADELIEDWTHAMVQVSRLQGFLINSHNSSRRERQVIQEVVDRVGGRSDYRTNVSDPPVGYVQRITEVLGIEEGGVKMIGFYGTDVVGKKTLAKEILDGLSGRFDKRIYVDGIKDRARNYGLPQLQRQFISRAFNDEEEEIYSYSEGINRIKTRFRHARVLVILDDVDDGDQLRALAGGHDWFGEGTRILITTRDVNLLDAHPVDRKYEARRFMQY